MAILKYQLIIIDNKKPKNAVKYFKVKSGGADKNLIKQK